MVTFFLFLLSIASIVYGFVKLYERRANRQPEYEVQFEAKTELPHDRPLITSCSEGGLLKIEAPVIHARLVSEILVLDVKSGMGEAAIGLEIAVTEFDLNWLDASSYKHHESLGQLLIGPQGDLTDRLLHHISKRHGIDLPASAGSYVQAFPIASVVTDPAEFSVHITAILPSGEDLRLSYDYAGSVASAGVMTTALKAETNYSPLQVTLETA